MAGGRVLGSLCPGGEGSQQVPDGAMLLRRGRCGTEGLVGDSDYWMAQMAEDWCRDWRTKEVVGEGGCTGLTRQVYGLLVQAKVSRIISSPNTKLNSASSNNSSNSQEWEGRQGSLSKN